jgi:A/G-specific adenine glycosylase
VGTRDGAPLEFRIVSAAPDLEDGREQVCDDLREMPESPLHTPVLDWYAEQARDLPWRRPGTSPWAVLVSEVMLQQTPVARVEPVYLAWLERWPTPGDLAAEPAGEAVRMWGRLGYPRRALRLHAAAVQVVERYGGELPAAYDDLRTLPGIGDYTAAALLSFAHGQRRAVLDTNVRRVLARAAGGVAQPGPSLTGPERARAEALVPDEPAVAARWAVAAMELGALVCTARSPRCERCPVAGMCAWRLAGSPAYDGPVRAAQPWAGTDRQVRGRLMAVLRERAEDDGPAPADDLDAAWDDVEQRDRALAGLLVDGLVVGDPVAGYRLP